MKELIREGVYEHPIDGWTLKVTPERMDRWAETFNRMQAASIKPYIAINHSADARDYAGELVEVFRDGASLFGVHELVGQEAIDTALKVDRTSLLIDPDYTDGKGVKFGEAIVHNAIVVDPVVAEQDGFVPVAGPTAKAASRAPVYRLQRNPDMSTVFEFVAKTTGKKPEEVTAENAAALLETHLQGMKTASDQAAAKVRDLELKVETLSKAAKPEPKELDPDLAEQLGEVAEEKLAQLVAAGHITPACCTKLKAVFVGEAGKRPAFSLSRSASGGNKSLFSQVHEALQDNKPTDLKPKTGIQLSRNVPGGDDDSAKEAEEVAKKMRESAWGHRQAAVVK